VKQSKAGRPIVIYLGARSPEPRLGFNAEVHEACFASAVSSRSNWAQEVETRALILPLFKTVRPLDLARRRKYCFKRGLEVLSAYEANPLDQLPRLSTSP
jgi:hypothetical protein